MGTSKCHLFAWLRESDTERPLKDPSYIAVQVHQKVYLPTRISSLLSGGWNISTDFCTSLKYDQYKICKMPRMIYCFALSQMLKMIYSYLLTGYGKERLLGNYSTDLLPITETILESFSVGNLIFERK